MAAEVWSKRRNWTPGCSNRGDYLKWVCYSLNEALGPLSLSSIRRRITTASSSTLCWASHSCHSTQATLVKENPDPLENMAFSGTWQVYSQENYEEFLKAMGEKNKPSGAAAVATWRACRNVLCLATEDKQWFSCGQSLLMFIITAQMWQL